MTWWANARLMLWVVLASIAVCPACSLFATSDDKFHSGGSAPNDAGVDGPDDEAGLPVPWDAPCESEVDAETAPDAELAEDAEVVMDAHPLTDAADAPAGSDPDAPSDGQSPTAAGTGTVMIATADAGDAIATSSNTGSQGGSVTATGTSTQTTPPLATGSGSSTSTGSQTSRTTAISTVTGSGTRTATGTQTASGTGTRTGSGTLSASGTRTGSGSGSATSTPTVTATTSLSGTQTGSTSPTVTATGTRATATGTATTTLTNTASTTLTGTGTGSTTATPTSTNTATSTVPVTGVALDKTEARLSLPGTVQLTATVLPADATNRAIIWSTNNSGVATVSSSGLVSAVGTGTAAVIVTTVDGGKTATCTLTIVISVASVTLNTNAATMGLGQTVSLTATIAPANATNKNLSWTSSDPNVATVSATGASAVVTAVAAGGATITVTTEDGGKTATCEVTVALAAQWVKTPTSAKATSMFSALALDGSGNIYAVGYIRSTESLSFSGSVSVTGSSASQNAVLVKYAADGTVRWARTVAGATGASLFTGVAVDAAGNIFAVGTISGSYSYDFGHSVVVTGAYAFGTSLVLVKYDGNGTAQWARTVAVANATTSFAAVATDPTGNVYAAGAITDSSAYDLGSGVTVSGAVSSGKNALLAKYNAAGVTQWARSLRTGVGESSFAGVAVDGAGHVYGAGSVAGNLSFGFGGSATGKGSAGVNALLVQYGSDGVAQWARTASNGGKDSLLTAVAIGNAGDVFVAGGIDGNTADDFGSGVSVAGAYASGTSILLLKYDSGGTTRWGRSLFSATGLSRFASLAIDASDHIYAAGIIAGPASYDFGSLITAAATSNGNEILLVKYDSMGACLRAQTAAAGSSNSGFYAVGVDDGSGAVYAAGYVNGTNPVDFGNAITATGAYSGGTNAMLVKYR